MAVFPVTLPGLLALVVIVVGLGVAVWRKYPMSYTMGLLCLGVFVIQLGSEAWGMCRVGLFRADCALADLSFIAPPTVEGGQRILTPFTYMFIHSGLLHLAGNMFILLTAGPALEERIGSRNFLILYLLAGLGAAAATVGLWKVGFFSGGQELSPNVGASGAIFGVLTGFAVLYPREKLPMVLPMMFFVLWLPSFAVLALYLAINVVYIVSDTNIAWWGHFAGFFVGVVVAPFLHTRLPVRRTGKPLRIDTAALAPLAETNVQRNALRELDRLQHGQTPDDRALADMWWDRFAAQAHCPVCRTRLKPRDGVLACPRGDYEVQAMRE